jgi:outer membrane immunogenic protein
MRKFTLSLLAFSALTGAAAAADLAGEKAPPAFAPESVNWTGPYGGAQAGGAFGSTDFNLPSAAYSSSWRNDGFIGGAHFGYNYQINSLVFGVQGSFDFLSVEGNLSSAVPYAPKAFTAKSYHDWLASADGRLGYAFKNYLIYAIGGYAFLANNTALNVAGTQVAGVSNAINGYDVGAGVEYAINNKWSARLEYRYYNFASNTNNLLNSPKNFSESYSTSVVRAGITYKFGGTETTVAAAKY